MMRCVAAWVFAGCAPTTPCRAPTVQTSLWTGLSTPSFDSKTLTPPTPRPFLQRVPGALPSWAAFQLPASGGPTLKTSPFAIPAALHCTVGERSTERQMSFGLRKSISETQNRRHAVIALHNDRACHTGAGTLLANGSDCGEKAKQKTLRQAIAQGEGGGVRGEKVCVPKIGLKFRAPLIHFIFCRRKIFLIFGGGAAGAGQGPTQPPPPPAPRGPSAMACSAPLSRPFVRTTEGVVSVIFSAFTVALTWGSGVGTTVGWGTGVGMGADVPVAWAGAGGPGRGCRLLPAASVRRTWRRCAPWPTPPKSRAGPPSGGWASDGSRCSRWPIACRCCAHCAAACLAPPPPPRATYI